MKPVIDLGTQEEPQMKHEVAIMLDSFKNALPLGVIEELEFQQIIEEGFDRIKLEYPTLDFNELFHMNLRKEH